MGVINIEVIFNDNVKEYHTGVPICPICGEMTIGVFYQDPDEGFFMFMWKCPNGHHLDSTNEKPKCPYCNRDTIVTSIENHNNTWDQFWGCTCGGVQKAERILNQA